MSEERIPLDDTFDFSKNITNISVSTNYILGLQQLMLYLIESLPNPASVKQIFEKFELYIEGKYDIEKTPFSNEEMHLYTIYSLYSLFKGRAYEQGLNVKVNATLNQKDVEEILEAAIKGDTDKIKELNEKMQKDLESQLS